MHARRWLWIVALGLVAAARADEPKGAAVRWAGELKRFDEQDKANPFPKGGVVFVGSSSVRLWDLAKSFPDVKALNRGFGVIRM